MGMKPRRVNRRTFGKAVLAASLSATVIPLRAHGQGAAANERITVGMVGLGGMGMGHVRRFLQSPDVQVVAVCDVHKRHYRDMDRGKRGPCGREAAKAIVEDYYSDQTARGSFTGCAAYADFRELCARDDIDVVVVATPDHWHALCTLEALRNGKDVYCEKPLTHLFREGQIVAEEVAKQKAIFQTGSQQRSDPGFRRCVELVRNGHIGKLVRVEVGLPPGPSEAQGDASVTEPPAELDYDFWCGPSEILPYMRARHHRWWRFYRAYGGGNIMDWIGHHNDIAHWGMGVERSGPIEVEAGGEWTPAAFEGYNTPVHYDIRCSYPDGGTSSISDRHTLGVKWIGEDGWIWADRGKSDASNRAMLADDFEVGPFAAYDSRNHVQNFLDGVRTRTECIAPAEIGHRSVTPGHLGYVSWEFGRKLRWDPKNETIFGDVEADRLLNHVDYRAPWKLPK